MTNRNPYSTTESRCTSDCAGGRPCCCTTMPHELHVCSVPTCECHKPHAYGLVRVGDEYRQIRRLVE